MSTKLVDSIPDVVIIGGSYAGISAAMPLARARRRVTVYDGAKRRNRFTHHAHGFITNDGKDPADIHRTAKAELLKYPTVTWRDEEATAEVKARRIIIATGIKDELPPIEGLAERWGKSVFVCPYCDGYEQNMGRLGLIGINERAEHMFALLHEWGKPTLIPADSITRVIDHASIVTKDGNTHVFDAIFTGVHTTQASPVAEQLGCAFDDGPTGPVIRVDAMNATTVPNVFACGDAARAMSNVAIAVGDGFRAGVAAHASLLFAQPLAHAK